MQRSDSDSPASNEENLPHSDSCPDSAVEEEECQQSPRSKANKKLSIHQRSLQGVLVQIARNAYPRSEPKRYRLVSIEKLLKESMEIVSLNSQATKIFRKDGSVVKTIDDVNDNDVLYISSGEKFNYGYSPTKRHLPKHEAVETRSAQIEEPLPEEPVKTKTEIRQENKKNRFQQEILSFQRIIAISKKTADDTFKEATASVFAQLNENQRRRLPNWYQVQYAHDETQEARLIEQLINQHICPTNANILPEVHEWSIDLLRGIECNDIRFVITGPRQSGKTTLLYTTSTLLMKKFQNSDIASRYLFFPINFEIETLEISDHVHLLRRFMSIAFDAVEYCHFAFLPLMAQLRKWFAMSVFGAQVQFPTSIQTFPEVDIKSLQELAKKLYNSLHGTGPDGLKDYVNAVCEFPSQLAKALGLSGVIFVVDSFEYSDVYFTPNEECFPESIRPTSLSLALCNELQKGLYLVSLQDEQRFMECFTCNNAALIDTEGIIKGLKNEVAVVIRQPPLRISVDECLGCPGYITRFATICELVKRIDINSAVPSSYSMVQTSSDRSRLSVVKQEIVRLAELLSGAGSAVVTKDILNRLIDLDLINVKYVTPNSIYVNEEEEEIVEKIESKQKINNKQISNQNEENEENDPFVQDIKLKA